MVVCAYKTERLRVFELTCLHINQQKHTTSIVTPAPMLPEELQHCIDCQFHSRHHAYHLVRDAIKIITIHHFADRRLDRISPMWLLCYTHEGS